MEFFKNRTFALKGIIVHTPDFDHMEYHENEYVICKDGRSVGIFHELPEEYQEIPVLDFSDKFIIPGMCDMHVHAPQYGFRGLGMLLDCNSEWETWFDRYSFPEESRYADLEYADKAYGRFVDDLLKTTTTTRASIFATIHRPATELLMRKLADAGFSAYVGKLNMDRNSRFGLQETTEETLKETERWLKETETGYGQVKPILTPRYTPTCTDACMEGLQVLSEKYQVPVQSHLSEGLDEIEWVKQLKPGLSCYGEAYDMYDLLGSRQPAVMAHVVHPNEAEYELIKHRNVLVAHCPQSNTNLSSGVMPLRRSLSEGLRCCVASDVAGGHAAAMNRHVAATVGLSKLRALDHPEERPLSLPEALYLATKGPGEFFGKVGSFEPGYDFDALVVDVDELDGRLSRTPFEKLEQFLYDGDDRDILARYSRGSLVEKPFTE